MCCCIRAICRDLCCGCAHVDDCLMSKDLFQFGDTHTQDPVAVTSYEDVGMYNDLPVFCTGSGTVQRQPQDLYDAGRCRYRCTSAGRAGLRESVAVLDGQNVFQSPRRS